MGRSIALWAGLLIYNLLIKYLIDISSFASLYLGFMMAHCTAAALGEKLHFIIIIIISI